VKVIVGTVLFAILFFINPAQALSESNFLTDYNVIYTINEGGITNVNFEISLTNKTSQYYAGSYSIEVGYNDLTNVKASDQSGSIKPFINKKNGETSIELNFNQKAVGINNKLNFSLSFDTQSVAKKAGRIWEVNIPGFSNQDSFENFNVSVEVPDSFGKPSYIKPNLANSSIDSLTFTKEHLGKSGIYIGFGDYQVYKFNLIYHLQNPNLFKVKTEIAIPPSTGYQEVQIQDLDPKPQNVTLDDDGNWIAEYSLSSLQKIDVVVKGKAKVNRLPQKTTLTEDQVQMYLKDQPYWEASSHEIKSLAQKLKTPKAIYKYVVDNLSYDIKRVDERKERLGAANVLHNPKSAVCLEFTDLFIALARAAGIPAREVDGFAYTQNSKERPLSLLKDILHAWPEYYDFERESWIMVDPTWGNTTKGLDYFDVLDFEHFAFVIKGKSSQYPIPAGGYKLDGQEALKDIEVSFDDSFERLNPQFAIEWDFSKSYASFLPINGNIIIKNIGNIVLDARVATIAAGFLKPKTKEAYLEKIPPFGSSIIEVKFHPTSILTNRSDVVTIAIADRLSSETLETYPIFLDKKFLIGGGILIAIIIVIILFFFAIKTGSLSFFGQSEPNFVRWKGKKS